MSDIFISYASEDRHSVRSLAGALLVAEAGGIVSDFRGGPLDIYRPEIVASNPHIHDAILQVLSLPPD